VRAAGDVTPADPTSTASPTSTARPPAAPTQPNAAETEDDAEEPVREVTPAKRPKAAAAPSAAESALVAEAFSSLRTKHAPNRAIVLVDTYLEDYPDGALREEALALGIEAAHVTDPAKAREFAAQYLGAFPSGRYEKEARRILSRPR
jgi:hypothetical protein